MVQVDMLSQQKPLAPCLASEGGRGQVGLWSLGLSDIQYSRLPFMSHALSPTVTGARDTTANQTWAFLEELVVWGKLPWKQVTSVPWDTCCYRDLQAAR